MTIELAENLFEIIVVGLCFAAVLPRALQTWKRSWALLSFFYAAMLLGALYWTLYLVFYHRTPPVFYVSELSWCAAYLFLSLLLRHYQTDAERSVRSSILWAIVIFIVGMTAFYFRWGDYLLNVTDAVLMGFLMVRSAQGLLALREKADERKRLYITVFLFCMIEYALWTSSCFWMGDTIRNPYFWFSAVLVGFQPLFIPAVRKAEGR